MPGNRQSGGAFRNRANCPYDRLLALSLYTTVEPRQQVRYRIVDVSARRGLPVADTWRGGEVSSAVCGCPPQ